jgi:hypothetical protein
MKTKARRASAGKERCFFSSWWWEGPARIAKSRREEQIEAIEAKSRLQPCDFQPVKI